MLSHFLFCLINYIILSTSNIVPNNIPNNISNNMSDKVPNNLPNNRPNHKLFISNIK